MFDVKFHSNFAWIATLAVPFLLTGCGASAVSGISFPNASSSYASAPLETLQLELEGMGFKDVQTDEVANDLDPSHDGLVTEFSVDGTCPVHSQLSG